MQVTDKITITNEDNMQLMARYPDKYFDIGIVDPPYGSSNIKGGYTSGKGGGIASAKNYDQSLWDQKPPDEAYFIELNRVCKNVIIWGANHFYGTMSKSGVIKDSSGWICWDKQNGEVSFSDGELAYTSFDCKLRIYQFRWSGMLQKDMKNKEFRIHPTQKPVGLYKWILDKYAKPGYKILDTHLGSGSNVIACHDYGYQITASELVEKYFNDTVKRIKNHINQQKLF